MPDYEVRETPVQVVKQRLFCTCGLEMYHTGIVLASFPPQYPHQCGAGHVTVPPHPNVGYPQISFKDVTVTALEMPTQEDIADIIERKTDGNSQ